ncbi:MAG: transporter substrate-binding domain-containing protein [Chloroflexi bacterium]|nr:transporter substrate-binding domain-containing protein [Chloroflexota bacterium]MCY3583383.1 transporter substrate-binding domain-containing protein [Chloroflexota bacterium]MCY3715434.1 transporter substrate-binding domain-containing protein [Chloroflexota bacterium]MDE2649643.1 transporter substrate-binding domain-containing protein [Chloroflexota bacterium]MXX83366.1 amino acid ABC transporter substrate-binding protein [Chloroflexota bacterium]
MNRWLATLLVFCLLAAALAQDATPVPTLAVPTLLPAAMPEAPSRPSQSAIADISARGVFRVGVLYNNPPYSELTWQGELTGFDIELLREIAAGWGVEVAFSQVTRMNAIDALQRGDVHALASALLHYRGYEDEIEFTQRYLVGHQAVMARADSPLQAPDELAGVKAGVVIGTRAEMALGLWREHSGITPETRPFFTLDRAFAALRLGEIDALLAEEQSLLRVAGEELPHVRILDEPLLREPHAFAVRRHDAPLRQLLNRSIQHLAETQQIELLQREYFPDLARDADTIVVWQHVGEEVTPSQFAAEISAPAESTLTRLLEGEALRVAGLEADMPHVAALNRALVTEMARRWAVPVVESAVSADAVLQSLRQGEVDLVAGVKLDWQMAGGINFSMPYLLQGDRLMVPARSQVANFYDLRNRIVAVMLGDDKAWQRAQAWADSINITIRRFDTTLRGAAQTLLEHNNANAVFANSLQLVDHLNTNPGTLKLTERWYSHDYYAFALGYNDPDFRQLVNYTLQEVILDGSLARMTGGLLLGGDLPDFSITPGSSQFVGLNLASA